MTNLVKEFKSQLKEKSGDYIINMYDHLFSLLTEDELNELLEVWFNEYKVNDGWYFLFHKSIRQTDFFNNIHAYRIIDRLTPEQRKRRLELITIRKKEYKKYEEEFPYDHDMIEYKKFNNSPERIKSSDELKTLNSLMRTEDECSIGGHLDMLLWNTIHLDDKDELKNIFERTFKLYS